VPELVPDFSALTAPGVAEITVATLAGGNFLGYEICTEASLCKAGVPTGGNPEDDLRNGALSSPRSIAVDQDSGDVYVTDSGNRRVNVYDGVGNFIRSFGWGVVRPGDPGDAPGDDEVQSLTIHPSTTGGRFALLFNGQTTGAAGSGRRTEGSTLLTQISTSSGAFKVGQIITGSGIPNGTTIVAIAPVAKTITLSNAATSGSNTNTTLTGDDIPWDASPAQVQVALEGIAGIGAGNVAVSSASPGGGVVGGPFEVTFQGQLGERDVAVLTASAAGLTATTKSVAIATVVAGGPGYEICEAPAVCRQGAVGSRVGQLGSNAAGIAVSPADGNAATGTLFVADPANRRVNTYDLDGQNPSSFGSEAEFGAGQPQSVAIDSRGIVYTSNNQAFDAISDYAAERLTLFVTKRHARSREYGWSVFAFQSPDRLGLIDLNGSVVAPRPHRTWRG